VRYLELIADNPLVWGLFGLYVVVTVLLAYRGHKKTGDIQSYSIGRGDMSPVVVGIALAASIASVATFVINPGFVYAHGISALMHFGPAVSLGIILGLVGMSVGFRRIGARSRAVTLPQWVGERYGSRGLALFFALINLLSLAFVVLILGGLSIVMQSTLGLSNVESLVLMTVFVFGYVFLGGAYAHAYTNTVQGVLMVVVSILIVASGITLFGDGFGAFADRIAAADPALLSLVNTESALYGSVFSIYVSGVIIGFALTCQPHILTKALYVRDDRSVWQYLGVAIAVGLLFSALLLVGLYARVIGIESVPQDAVMTAYINEAFSPAVVAFITVVFLAAGMSTLDGILVALSSIAGNDIFLNLAEKRMLKNASPDQKARAAHRVSLVILVGIGVVAFLIALNPPQLLGLFGQVGVYGIVAASAVPILFGILVPSMGARTAAAAAVTGLVVHFGLYGLVRWADATGVTLAPPGALTLFFDTAMPQLGFRNPGVTATYGLLASVAVAMPATLHHLALSRRAARPSAAAARSVRDGLEGAKS
jgi:sodium/pantothenate symporter